MEANLDPKQLKLQKQKLMPAEPWEHKTMTKKKRNVRFLDDEFPPPSQAQTEQQNKKEESRLAQELAAKKKEEEQKKLMREKQRQIIEQRLNKELPAEISKRVYDTVKSELDKLKTALGMQNNTLNEQIQLLKGNVQKNNQRKKDLDFCLQELTAEIKSHQLSDEIKSREIYDQYIKRVQNEQMVIQDKVVNPNALFDFDIKKSDDYAYLAKLDEQQRREQELRHPAPKVKSLTDGYNPIEYANRTKFKDYN